jgi:HSP20 family protein
MNTLTKTNGGLRTRSLFPRTLLSDDFFNLTWPGFDFFNGNGFSDAWMPAANLKEDEKSFTVELSVPGYAKKDISVKVEDNILTISGERKEETKEKKKNYTRQEFSYGTFSRSFELPETVNDGKISAKCTDGVLLIELPKSEVTVTAKKTKEIPVA